jgi:hypothetical protein
MNRVIKFRAWDSNRNYFLPLDDDGDYYFRDDNNGLELWDKSGRCKAAILQQFTGLLDKNGNEIYEGDILCKEGNFGIQVVFDNGIRVMDIEPVRFNNKCLYAHIYDFDLNGWGVYGNIYQHPELLNSQSK